MKMMRIQVFPLIERRTNHPLMASQEIDALAQALSFCTARGAALDEKA
jgi:hypothetical protein